jgi:hypothetical protein
MDTTKFLEFFDWCVGSWATERTYHYLTHQEVERSRTEFTIKTKELLMTTNYTRLVSVDSITLVNPNLRIRKIINYQRPAEEQPLEQVTLVGFGVE